MAAEILGKLRDSLAMFYEALDERERKVVIIAGLYIACTVVAAVNQSQNEKRRQRIVADVVAQVNEGRHGTHA